MSGPGASCERHTWCITLDESSSEHIDMCWSSIADLAGTIGAPDAHDYRDGWGAWLTWRDDTGVVVQFDAGEAATPSELVTRVGHGSMPALRPVHVAVVLAATATPQARQALIELLCHADPPLSGLNEEADR